MQTLADFNATGSDQELHTLFKFSPQICLYFEHMNKIAQDQADLESSKWLRNTMATTQKDSEQTVELTAFDETVQLFNTYKQSNVAQRIWEHGQLQLSEIPPVQQPAELEAMVSTFVAQF